MGPEHFRNDAFAGTVGRRISDHFQHDLVTGTSSFGSRVTHEYRIWKLGAIHLHDADPGSFRIRSHELLRGTLQDLQNFATHARLAPFAAAFANADPHQVSVGRVSRAAGRNKDVVLPADGDRFPTLDEVEATPVRCPDPAVAARMIERIEEARRDGDSVGGIIEARVRGLPAGWGAPVFDRLEADLAKAMLSLPATKGFEVGSGFAGVALRGSEHNDAYVRRADGTVGTASNRSGGVQGGISNGEDLVFRVAFKPTATILREQETLGRDGEPVVLRGRGRHDPCVVPRAVPIVEAMAALVLVDHAMRHGAQTGTFVLPPVPDALLEDAAGSADPHHP